MFEFEHLLREILRDIFRDVLVAIREGDEKVIHAIKEGNERNGRLLHQILHRLPPIHRTHSAAIVFGGNMAATPGTQAVGSTLTASVVPIEIDGVTVTPGSSLTTPPSFAVDNPAIATLVDNGNGTATITGVSAGTATITASGGVFTDSDGQATASLDATNTDTVTQPTGRTVSMQINFV